MTSKQRRIALRVVFVLLVGSASPLLVVLGAMAFGVAPSALQGSGFTVTTPQVVALLAISAVSMGVPTLAWVLWHGRPARELYAGARPMRGFGMGLVLGLLVAAAILVLRIALARHVEVRGAVPADVGPLEFLGGYVFFVVVVLLLNSLKEELLFRAYPIASAIQHDLPLGWSCIASAALFAAMHLILEAPSLLGFVDRFLYGILFAQAYVIAGSVWGAVGAHSGVNLVWTTISGDWRMGGLCAVDLTRSEISTAWTSPVVLLLAVFSLFLVIRARAGASRPQRAPPGGG